MLESVAQSQTVSRDSDGAVGTVTGDVLTTGSGRYHILLSDGVYGLVPEGILLSDYSEYDSDAVTATDTDPTAPAEVPVENPTP